MKRIGQRNTLHGHTKTSEAGIADLAASSVGSIRFRTGTTERMRITSTGNIGIGTTSPNSNVEIKENANNGEGAELRVINDGTAAGTGQTTTITIGRNFEERNIKIKSVSSEDYGRKPELVITQNQNESGSSHTEVLRINSTGNVGIGTTDPQSKLQVDGGVQMADDTDAASASKVGTLRYRTSGNNSYVDMCMQTGATTYEWINIVQNNW